MWTSSVSIVISITVGGHVVYVADISCKCVLFEMGNGWCYNAYFFFWSHFREAGVYGRAAGKDGTVPDVCEPDAEFHICFT